MAKAAVPEVPKKVSADVKPTGVRKSISNIRTRLARHGKRSQIGF